MNLIPYKKSFSLSLALLFSLLFYQKTLGLNLFMFELVSIALAFFLFKPKFNTVLSKIILFATLITSIMVLAHNSSIAKTVNIGSYLLLIGSVSSPNFLLFKNYIFQAIENSYQATDKFFNSLVGNTEKRTNLFYYFKIIGIPSLLIVFFLLIYYNSNSYFSQLIDSFFNAISTFFNWFPEISFSLFITFIIGLLVSISIIYNKINAERLKEELELTDDMRRKRFPLKKKSFIALKNEYKSAVFLLIGLNALLALFNYSDITTVWISFEWKGEFLKEFVHSGTYLLIVSLVVSIILVLYFFRGNLNFYKQNKLLKILTYIWLYQNLLLVISLFIRNSIYIHHFALAYKRIGVFAFLIVVVVSIITILIKVRDKKSYTYIVKKNTISIYLVLVVLTFFNWDVIIAKYNLNSYEKAFVEMDFISELSDKALPYINLNDEVLNKIDTKQNDLFSFKSRSSYYLSKESYKERVESRILNFKINYPKRSWIEWNYADYRAYKKLMQKKTSPIN